MKKPKIFILLTILALFLGINTVRATTYTLEELGDEMEYINPSVSYAYVIGDHVFTSANTFNLQHFMLGARSITVQGENGMSQNDLLTKMDIVRIVWEGTGTNNKSIFTASQYIGTGSNLTSFDIKYIDFIPVENFAKQTITFKNGTEVFETIEIRLGEDIKTPADTPEKAGYIFAGWVDESNNPIQVGDKVTGDATYTATWTKIVGADSEVVINPLTSLSAPEYWAYINGSFAGFVENTTIAIDGDLKVTGKLVKENIEGFAPAGVKTEGYYFAYTVELPAGLTTADVQNMVLKSGNKTLGVEVFDSANGWVAIVKLADDGSTTSVSFTIDWDGDGYDYEETTYTFDLSGVVYGEDSEVVVNPLKSSSAPEYWAYINGSFAGFVENTTIAIDGDLKVTGKLVKENIEGFAPAGVKTEGYYFAYTVELPAGLTTADVQNMVLKSGNKTLGVEVFDSANGWVAILKLAEGATSTSFTIDWDGDGLDYAETTYTFDLSGVVYASDSEVVVNPLTSSSAPEYWAYINGSFAGFVENTTIAIDGDLKMTGTVSKEDIEGFAPAGVTTEGYYVAYTVELPAGLTIADVQNMVLKSGNKTLGVEVFDSANGWVAIFKLADDKSAETITFTIDWDGDGYDYSATTYVIDVSELIYAD